MTSPRPWSCRWSAPRRLAAAAAVLLALLLARCVGAPPAPPPLPLASATADDAIEVCGQRYSIGTRVVSWREAPFYDAYRLGKRFDADTPPDGKSRVAPRGGLPAGMTARAADRTLTLADLQQVVHTFVLHYDVAGTSRQCFKVLQDVRGLSVHFLLDVDGTIYQTLDLREKAQHATYANDFSVGIEIAHPGAFPQPMNATMRPWYDKDAEGYRLKLPAWMKETGIRTPGFVARPARPDIISGTVQGRTWYQLDFTPQQYAALTRLTAALSRLLPRIRLEAPRQPDGSIIDHALGEERLRAFDGVVGHFHVQANKQDPGPAMQWDHLLDGARAVR
ncbi:MAG: N-acetylmuramoyl-L-alanine amidase [Planctomycetes bacterium]|nr:N-acetylmuramoyl-L-alanine amidase [Planctomycetota bacterium]